MDDTSSVLDDSLDWQTARSATSQANLSDVNSVYMETGCTCSQGIHGPRPGATAAGAQGTISKYDVTRRRTDRECLHCSRVSMLSSYSIDVDKLGSSHRSVETCADNDVMTQLAGARGRGVMRRTTAMDVDDDQFTHRSSLPASPRLEPRNSTNRGKHLQRRNTDYDLSDGINMLRLSGLGKVAKTSRPMTAVDRVKLSENVPMQSTPNLAHSRQKSTASSVNEDNVDYDVTPKPPAAVRPRLMKHATYHAPGTGLHEDVPKRTRQGINQSQPNLEASRDEQRPVFGLYPHSCDITPQTSPVAKKRGLLMRRGSQFSRKIMASLAGIKTSSPSPHGSPKAKRVESPQVPSSPISSATSSSKDESDGVDNTSQIIRAILQPEQVSQIIRAILQPEQVS